MSKNNHKTRLVPVGIVHINATFNNTIVTISDPNGLVVAWSSSGCNKAFKGSKKSTPYAAQMAAESVADKAINLGMKTLSIRLNGPGSGRESAVRVFASKGFNVTGIRDVTPIPHNGCRPPKRRRV